MIQNITNPLWENSPLDVLDEIKEETEKGLTLQLIREYQIKYGNGSE